MDIITFFEDLTEIWNAEQKCDSCWSFGAPLSEAGMNATEKADSEVCCTHLIITDYETSSSYTKHDNTDLKNREWCDHIFTLYAVRQSNLGLNTYNEQQGHPISESLWKTILQPIQSCLGCGNEIDLCEMGYSFEIFSWKMKVAKYLYDQNYTGWRILGIFRQYT